MPRRDGTGPSGMGPMTGRGAGNCTEATSENTERESVSRPRLGLGLNRPPGGRGMGLRRGFRGGR